MTCTETCLENLSGIKRYGAAFLLGALMALAMPPLGIFLVLLLSVPGFIVLTRAAPSTCRAFLVAWLFGAGYFIAGLHWVSAALFVDIGRWGWVMPFSLVIGPAVFGLWYGLIPLATRWLRASPVPYALLTVAAWAGVEWLRGHMLTGLPWNLAGYAWIWALPTMQAAAFVGIYGLTLLTLLWAVAPLVWRTKHLSWIIPFSFIVVSLLGFARTMTIPAENTDYSVRIVQANVPQTLKWDEDSMWNNVERYGDLSNRKEHADIVIWPETAIAADLGVSQDIAQYAMLRLPGDSLGIFGTQRAVEEEDGTYKYYNSVTTLNLHAVVMDVYDKHHLVPFGEYIPFRNKLNLTPIAAALAGTGDFTPGPGPRTIRVSDLPSFSPLICYEAIFPGEVVDRKDRPEWMVNVTNDGWYGNSAGPYQHFEISRMRAIEQGLPLARAANTGISAMVDPLGRVTGRIALGNAGYLDAKLPRALEPTVYARFGDLPFFFLLALVAGWSVALRGCRGKDG